MELDREKTFFNPYRPPKKPPPGRKWVVAGRHKEKGYPIRWRLVSAEPYVPSFDELPPPGVETKELSETSPPTMAGVTVQQVEKSAKKGVPITFVDKSAPKD